ncbi:acetylglutamate kinase [Gorillibacterium sp. sgz500922]|uniref:acetylglutamate kinase n=1 Tax=Gorillibacterium sp. sgz500922 TaxID=3446694 RepID=UPI003F670EC4
MYSGGYPVMYRKLPPSGWSPAMVELNQKLRSLWSQHVYWTRLAVNSLIGQYADQQAALARLLRNPKDFAAVLKPLYGEEAASTFDQLLTAHLSIAAELVKALRDGDQDKAKDANRRWYANADEIAAFLARINPYWSKAEWKAMMDQHLQLLTQEITSRLAGNYTASVALGDPIEQQALGMADVMTRGIVLQFPAMFHL